MEEYVFANTLNYKYYRNEMGMNKIEARNIGTSFLKRKKIDIDPYGGEFKLGDIFDYNIFYSFPIVDENGELLIGGDVLLLDKKTEFCFLVAGSPNFYDYHVKLFRIIILNELYDSEIGLKEYQKKKKDINNYDDFIHSIFLLLRSYPENFNAFSEFLDILILLDDDKNADKIIQELKYKSLSHNRETLEYFINGYEYFNSNSLINSKIEELNKILLIKDQSVNSLLKKYESILVDRQKDIEEMKAILKEENKK